MKEWGKKFGAGPGWTLVTGDRETVGQLLKASALTLRMSTTTRLWSWRATTRAASGPACGAKPAPWSAELTDRVPPGGRPPMMRPMQAGEVLSARPRTCPDLFLLRMIRPVGRNAPVLVPLLHDPWRRSFSRPPRLPATAISLSVFNGSGTIRRPAAVWKKISGLRG
jgi:hypothetical protein